MNVARLDVLRGVTRHMATAEDLETVLRSITTALVERADATVAHIFLYLHDDECPVCRTKSPGQRGPDNQRALHLSSGAGVPFGVGEPVHRIPFDTEVPSAHLIRTRTPVMIQNVADDPRWADEPEMLRVLRGLGIQGLVCLPLNCRGEA